MLLVDPPPEPRPKNATFPFPFSNGKLLKPLNVNPGNPGTVLPDRAISVRLPDGSGPQMPNRLLVLTPMVSVRNSAKNATLPTALSAGSRKSSKFAPGTPGTPPTPFLAMRLRVPTEFGPQIPLVLSVVTPPAPAAKKARKAIFPLALRTGSEKPLKLAPDTPGTPPIPARAIRSRFPTEFGPQRPSVVPTITPPTPISRLA